jgi:Metal-dependent hydrolase
MRKSILAGLLPALAFLAVSCGSSKSLTIVQYNVGAFSKEIDNSIPMISDMMKELGADALSLNEVDSCNGRHRNDQLADFAAAMGDWYNCYGCAMPYKGGGYGVGALTKDRIVRSVTLHLEKGSGSEPRACTIVETKEYVLASTHLDYRTADAQVLQAKQITDYMLREYSSSGKPVFLCGDFNAEPDSEVIGFLRGSWKILSVQGNTYSAVDPHSCIDYIMLLDNGVPCKVLSASIPMEFSSGDVKVASDHLPVLLKVKF